MLNRRTLAAVAIVLSSCQAIAQPADIKAELAKVMDAYALALRAGDLAEIMALWGTAPVFTREGMPAAVGREALEAAYRNVFATLRADLKFNIHEAEAAGELAWLRATSAGKVKVLATGAETDDAYNVLVVFRREGGAWKIRNYLYAASRPAK